MAKKRTTHRSSAGKKLYAVRDASGQFNDIQTYERAHRGDLAAKSTAEKASKKRAAAKPKRASVKKATKKKPRTGKVDPGPAKKKPR